MAAKVSRDYKEIESIITEVEQPFMELREKNRQYELILLGQNDQRLVMGLPEWFGTVAPIISSDASWMHTIYMSQLRLPLQLHVQPLSTTEGAKSSADSVEKWLSFSEQRLNPNGKIYNGLLNHISMYAFACAHLSWKPFTPPDPKEGDQAVADYRRDFYPFKLEVCHPNTVAFQGEDLNDITLFVRRFSMNVIDLVKNYGEGYKAGSDDPRLMTTILDRQFPFLRNGPGFNDRFDPFSNVQNRIEILEVDDGVTITHHICGFIDKKSGQMGQRITGDSSYYECQSYDNPFERPAGFIASANYLPVQGWHNALRPGMIHAYRNLENRDKTLLIANSKMLERPRHVASPSPADAATMPKNPDGTLKPIVWDMDNITLAPGYQQVTGVIDPALQYMLEASQAAVDRVSPLGAVSFDPKTLNNAPTSNLLLAQSAAVKPYESAQDALAALFQRVFKAICLAQPEIVKSADKQPVGNYVLTGKEHTFSRVTSNKIKTNYLQAGDSGSIQEADLKRPFEIEVGFVRDDQAARQAKREEAEAKYYTKDMVPRITFEQLLEDGDGVQNVTEQLVDVREDALVKMGQAGALTAVQEEMAKYIALGGGPPPEITKSAMAVPTGPSPVAQRGQAQNPEVSVGQPDVAAAEGVARGP